MKLKLKPVIGINVIKGYIVTECPTCGDGLQPYTNCSCGQEIDWTSSCSQEDEG